MSVQFRPEVASAPVYKQGKPAKPGGFKLSSNENPYPPLPSVVAAYTSNVDLNRYPDSQTTALRAALADHLGTSPDHIAVGAGSIAVLQSLLQTVANGGDEVIYPWRSFEGYPSVVRAMGATAVEVPLTSSFDHDIDAMVAAVTERTRALMVCTPNNPTGNTLSQAQVDKLIAAVPDHVMIILDEAYVEFADSDLDGIATVKAHPNVVSVRTFSKAYGLAGLRVGFAVADPAIVTAHNVVAAPFAVSAGTQAAALASLQAQSELDARIDEWRTRRDDLMAELEALGFSDIPMPHGNFIWLPLGEATAAAGEIFAEHGLVTRVFPGEGIRISVGEAESIEPLLSAAAIVVDNVLGTSRIAN